MNELNVLCIGNSFTRNATKFLPEIVKSFPDCEHAGIRGEYMMGRLWFEMLYDNDASITFKPEGLNEEEAAEITGNTN